MCQKRRGRQPSPCTSARCGLNQRRCLKQTRHKQLAAAKISGKFRIRVRSAALCMQNDGDTMLIIITATATIEIVSIWGEYTHYICKAQTSRNTFPAQLCAFCRHHCNGQIVHLEGKGLKGRAATSIPKPRCPRLWRTAPIPTGQEPSANKACGYLGMLSLNWARTCVKIFCEKMSSQRLTNASCAAADADLSMRFS